MANLMGQNTDKLVFIVHGLNQTTIEKNHAARRSKGIELITLHHKKVVIKVLWASHGEYALSKGVDILTNVGII